MSEVSPTADHTSELNVSSDENSQNSNDDIVAVEPEIVTVDLTKSDDEEEDCFELPPSASISQTSSSDGLSSEDSDEEEEHVLDRNEIKQEQNLTKSPEHSARSSAASHENPSCSSHHIAMPSLHMIDVAASREVKFTPMNCANQQSIDVNNSNNINENRQEENVAQVNTGDLKPPNMAGMKTINLIPIQMLLSPICEIDGKIYYHTTNSFNLH